MTEQAGPPEPPASDRASDDSAFDDLVDSTAGPQPLRRLFHAATGVAIVVAMEALQIPRSVALWILGSVLALQVALDVVRLRYSVVNRTFFRITRHLVTPRESAGVASSTWYTLGILLTIALFPRAAAMSAILVLALADPAASYLGRRWGRRSLLGGSLEGMAVFVVVSAVLLTLRHPPGISIVTSVRLSSRGHESRSATTVGG